jgi:hypothetical protein
MGHPTRERIMKEWRGTLMSLMNSELRPAHRQLLLCLHSCQPTSIPFGTGLKLLESYSRQNKEQSFVFQSERKLAFYKTAVVLPQKCLLNSWSLRGQVETITEEK